jgi:hypothetical protein
MISLYEIYQWEYVSGHMIHLQNNERISIKLGKH